VVVIRPKFALLVSSAVLSLPFKISGPVIVVLICPVPMLVISSASMLSRIPARL